MAKIKTSLQFKQYNQSANLLLPPNLNELIGPKDLVRVVNDMIDRWNISALMQQYVGGGTTAYHPRMLLKLLLYGYSCKIYTGRRIAREITKNIHFMWLAGGNRPDFRTLNNFRSGKAKQTIEELFSEMLKCLMEDGYVTMENYFCDGSTFYADANKNRMVWKKSARRYKELAEEKCRELFKEIDLINEDEDKICDNKDLGETGDQSEEITPEKIEERTKKFNEVIEKTIEGKIKRKAASIKKHLAEQKGKIVKYNDQIKKAGDRGGYSKTDEDATAMRMKNGEILPAYNLMAGSENQFIVNCSVHQNTNDATCFKAHLAQLANHSLVPENIIADSIFGTEENYEVLEQKEIGNFLKYPAIDKEEMPRYKPEPFSAETFKYDQASDCYICPNDRALVFKKTEKTEPRKSGYQSTLKVYECNDCKGCPFYNECCLAGKQTTRQIKINQKLDSYKKEAAENLRSSKGWELRKRRNIEIESCFGDIKHNMAIRRCHLRGLGKVKTDFSLIAMAHNLRKIHIIKQKIAS